MKINTDGVLLGALAYANNPTQILDIGTGTGVIALMLAQRFTKAHIEALEIDLTAAAVAGNNFGSSIFKSRLTCHAEGFDEYLKANNQKQYDLIVSNPPFYINSLKSPESLRATAKHADEEFFNRLIYNASIHLKKQGWLWLILPLDTAAMVQRIASQNGLYINKLIAVRSYPNAEPHRHIIAFSLTESYLAADTFVIYQSPKVYTQQYQLLLTNFFTIF